MLPVSLKSWWLNGYRAALARSSYPGSISRPESIVSKVKKHYTGRNRHPQVRKRNKGILRFLIESGSNVFAERRRLFLPLLQISGRCEYDPCVVSTHNSLTAYLFFWLLFLFDD
jgi:hypothetical protein